MRMSDAELVKSGIVKHAFDACKRKGMISTLMHSMHVNERE